ncbi:hypothetical protein AK812_SmicGene11586 [Symbiodinium microadriaticum]|uniref:Uncharacterized protein n=1 Tax=Symbiodinium microadriaticum TaxID=2951 RepID=A0A1Q9ED07_SYMMI|nr:hypothetical protein AK812_SmicGene11586 [Symbiodinium microadriaticum]
MPAAPWAHIEIGEPLLLAIMVSGRVKRTASVRSLPSEGADSSPPTSAQSFLLSTAQKSLAQALSGPDKGAKSDKKNKKKEKSSKKGQSSDSDGESSTAESADVGEDKQHLFRLLNKDLVRSIDQTKIEDLSCQQLAYTLSGLTKYVVASDVLQVGGESMKAAQSLWRKRLNQLQELSKEELSKKYDELLSKLAQVCDM